MAFPPGLMFPLCSCPFFPKPFLLCYASPAWPSHPASCSHCAPVHFFQSPSLLCYASPTWPSHTASCSYCAPVQSPLQPVLKPIFGVFEKFSPEPLANSKIIPTFASLNTGTPRQANKKNDGAIAQLVEQRTENPCVTGSIPVGTTSQIANNLIHRLLAIFISPNFSRVTYKVTYKMCVLTILNQPRRN